MLRLTLGLRFAPRLRDLSERRLYIVDRRADYGALDCLIGGAINLRKIEENWDEILRMTASIRAGTAAPSVLMWRLAAYPRQNALARALREIGCLERTLFILDWISDPALSANNRATSRFPPVTWIPAMPRCFRTILFLFC